MDETLEGLVQIDASTFQKPLGQLAEVLAQKVKREASALLPGPEFVAGDLHVLVRQAMRTYDLLFYLNADERRRADCYWKSEYTIVTLPLIRNMIDCLYNITAILQDPDQNGSWFRKSGYRQWLKALDEDQARYCGKPEWDEWITKSRREIDFLMRADDLTMDEVLAQTKWPTLGQYIRNKQPGGTLTPHQDFLRTLTYGAWREYSAMAHGTFEGLMRVAVYFISDSIPHEERPKLDEKHPRIMSMHIARAAAILLCIVTELQAHFHFDGARIDERIHKMWNALVPVFEVKELYDERYAQLMMDKHINP
ncbi:MAG TPA: hypothetical protein VGW33_14690 [Terriglobia bacterium]|nr:hypothetical protein [Terriglobia bacterium]